jgi:hypothetical protein
MIGIGPGRGGRDRKEVTVAGASVLTPSGRGAGAGMRASEGTA